MADREPVRAFIGLGSNLGDRRGRLEAGLVALGRLPESELLGRSSLYNSAPMGPQDQPDYLNAVAELRTVLSPLDLLSHLQAIEAAEGRERGPERWAARTLDLDLLLYGEQVIDLPRLIVPHPGLRQRNFVLIPLFELAPGLILPGGQALAELAAVAARDGLDRVDH